MTVYALILAGGGGTRLWPYSRQARPKQLLPLVEERSLLATTVARLEPFVPPERVVVLTSSAYVEETRAQLPAVPPCQIVGEPEALGNAASIGLGIALVGARDPDATLVVLPADHIIQPAEALRSALAATAMVAAGGWLVTLGVRPQRPETGYGYIELGERLVVGGSIEAFGVARFVEKPDQPTAEHFLASGRHVWNSGMFAWTQAAIREAYAHHLPDLAQRVDELEAAARKHEPGTPEFAARLAEIWPRVTDRTTIDYGIMEHSTRVACVPVSFQWTDIGSWAALADILPADEHGNVLVGDHVGYDTVRSIIFTPGEQLVATIGLTDLIVVATEDIVLVCPRDRAQDVRELVRRLRQEGRTDRL